MRFVPVSTLHSVLLMFAFFLLGTITRLTQYVVHHQFFLLVTSCLGALMSNGWAIPRIVTVELRLRPPASAGFLPYHDLATSVLTRNHRFLHTQLLPDLSHNRQICVSFNRAVVLVYVSIGWFCCVDSGSLVVCRICILVRLILVVRLLVVTDFADVLMIQMSSCFKGPAWQGKGGFNMKLSAPASLKAALTSLADRPHTLAFLHALCTERTCCFRS